jgi:two-component system, LuxR family, response regulator FixJ
VMDLVIAGKPNKIIAADLGISPKTVEIHRGRVMEKMQVESVAELVRLDLLHRANRAEGVDSE